MVVAAVAVVAVAVVAVAVVLEGEEVAGGSLLALCCRSISDSMFASTPARDHEYKERRRGWSNRF